MGEMDPKNLAEIMLHYDTSELAKTTEVKKVICPDDGAQKSHQSILLSIRGMLGGKRRKKQRKRSAKTESMFMLKDLEKDERYLVDGVTDFEKKINMFERRVREQKRQQNRRRTVAKILALYQADKKYADLSGRKLKLKIQQDQSKHAKWLQTDLSVWPIGDELY